MGETRENGPVHDPVLDGWRGVATLWVLVYHLDPAYGLHFWQVLHDLHGATGLGLEPYLARLPDLGFLGVDLFFVLSGFLITGLLLPELATGLRVRRFYLRRFFKIVPHYAVALGAGLALTYGPGALGYPPASGYLHPDTEILPYFFFLQNYAVAVPVLSHFWSLAVEEHFYLAYPLVLVALARMARLPALARRVDPRGLCALALVVLVVGVNLLRARELPLAATPLLRAQTTHLRVDAILFGCLMRLVAPLFSRTSKYGLLAVATALIARFFYYGFDPGRWSHYTQAYVAFGAAILATHDHGPGAHLLSASWLTALGRWSYGVYLWHPHVILIFSLLPWRAHGAWLVCGATSIAVGALATTWLEAYFLSVRRQLVP